MSNGLTRRHAIAGIGVATTLALGARSARADLAALEQGARKEGTLTWYIAQVDTETAEVMGRAFTKQYPDINVEVIRTTGQVAYQRLLQELKNSAPQCDVFSSTDISQYPALKAHNALAHYTPRNAGGLLPQFDKLIDPGFEYPAAATNHLLIYNTQKVKPADAPKRWTDLLDPRWKGQVATGHPAFSGCTGIWALALRKAYGWSFFEKLAKNDPRIGRSGNDPVTLITAGECLVGPAPANTAFQNVDKGNPIGPVYPADGATLCVGPSAVIAAAPHPQAARLFMEWLMSETYSRMSVALHGDPVRPGIELTSGQRPLDQVPILTLSVDEISKGVPEVIEAWRDTFGD